MDITTDVSTDLLVDLDRSRPRSLRNQLELGLRRAIAQGSLPPGTALPPSRVLAGELSVSRSLVVGAYEQLTSEGYLEARQGSGTRVRANRVDTVTDPDPAGNHRLGPTPEPAADAGRYWPLPPGPGGAPTARSGLPDPALFPRTEWVRHYRDVLRETADSGLLYPPPRGEQALRNALAAYLGRVRGVRTAADDIVICAGFSHGLALLCRVLAQRGVRRVVVEEPCFSLHRLIIKAAGLEPVPVPVSPEGLHVSSLSGLDGVGAVLLSPAHSFPTGVVLSARRRVALLEWARDTGGLVIEDDYDAELRFGRTPLGALQGLDPDRIAYGGTTSKVLSPALRLGWLVLPRHLTGDVIRAQLIDQFGNEAFGQLTLARFIDGGGLARHLRRVRPAYRARRDALLGALRHYLPQVPVTGEVAGLHLLLQLPAGWDPAAVAEAGVRRGLALEDPSLHWADPAAAPPALLIGYGTSRADALVSGVQALGAHASGAVRSAQ